MQRKSLLAALLAAAFAFPIAASAGEAGKQTSDTNKQSSAKPASANKDGGAEAMFASMDKNGDGFISKEEAAGTPHAADFASLDKNSDGKLSRDEHFNAKEHVAARSGASSGSAPATNPGAPSGKKTY